MSHTKKVVSLVVVALFLTSAAFPSTCSEGWVSFGPDGGQVNDVAVDPTDPSIVYAATNDGLFKSTNAGVAIARGGIYSLDCNVADFLEPARVLDLAPSFENNAALDPDEAWPTGNDLYFFAETVTSGRELWVFDGTELSTELVADLCPGSCPSVAPGLPYPDQVNAVSISDGRLFFESTDEVNGYSLWVSDGTADGTKPVFQPTAVATVQHLTSWLGRAYFLASNVDGSRYGLWESDGTEEGTVMVYDLEIGVDDLRDIQLATSDSRIYLLLNYEELVTYQPGAPPLRMRLENPFDLSYPLAAVGDRALFRTTMDNQTLLWSSDGTPEGTEQIYASTWMGDVGTVNNLFFFTAAGPVPGAGPLWVTDGTVEGTQPLPDVPEPNVVLAIAEEGRLVFTTISFTPEIWTTDGTVAGTSRIATMEEPVLSLASNSGVLYWTSSGLDNDERLWRFDPGELPVRLAEPFEQMTLQTFGQQVAVLGRYVRSSPRVVAFIDGHTVRTLNVRRPAAANPQDVVGVGEEVVWVSDRDVMVSDGSVDGTVVIGSLPGNGLQVIQSGEIVFILTYEALFAYEAGEQLVELLQAENQVMAGWAVPWERGILFSRYLDGQVELWQSDGTVDGTQAMGLLPTVGLSWVLSTVETSTGLQPLVQIEEPRSLPGTKTFLWTLDADGMPQALNECVDCRWRHFTPASDRTFFLEYGFSGVLPTNPELLAAEPASLWSTDGTVEGTQKIVDLNPFLSRYNYQFFGASGQPQQEYIVGFDDGMPSLRQTMVIGNLFFFTEESPENGVELWVSDGTAEGTHLVHDIRPGPASSMPSGFTVIGERLYFSADDGEHGREPWSTDGTEEGTSLVADLLPGPESSAVAEITLINGNVAYTANDSEHGREFWLWQPRRGVRLVEDLWEGPSSGSPENYLVVGDQLFFSAGNDETGRELWVAPLSAILMP